MLLFLMDKNYCKLVVPMMMGVAVVSRGRLYGQAVKK